MENQFDSNTQTGNEVPQNNGTPMGEINVPKNEQMDGAGIQAQSSPMPQPTVAQYDQAGMQYQQPGPQYNQVNPQYQQLGPQYNSAGQQYSDGYQEPKGKGFSITSMVTGIVAICTCCVWYFCLPLAIVSIVFGVISLVKKYEGRGMAIAGLITGGVALLMLILMCLLAVVSFRTYSFRSYL